MDEIEPDHEFQAIDTEVPDGEFVDEEAWSAMRADWLADHPEEDSE